MTYSRAGYAAAEEVVAHADLPGTVEELLETFDVIETITGVPAYDFMWNSAAEEARENKLMQLPFVIVKERCAPVSSPDGGTIDGNQICVAESAVKVSKHT